jgi:NAD(P) transhydrogenase subunit alpha
MSVMVEPSAGVEAGYTDEQYTAKGAVLASRADILAHCDVLTQYRSLGANPDEGRADVGLMKRGQIVIGLGEPLTAVQEAQTLANAGVSFFALELIPRTTRAQSMDVLSSMATISGYESVLLAAQSLPKLFPMLMTAAGTLTPAKVFIIGAGVAGLQAIATAKRLGGVVSAYDVRTAVKDQIVSVGAKFVTLEVEGAKAEGAGGYAREMDEAFYKRQRELMLEVVKEHDVVITTAAVPGKRAPVLVTREMVEAMAPGSVIVDIAAVRGGNCELTKPGETVRHNGVTILGPTNFASMAPYHASQMFSANVVTFLKHLIGFLPLDTIPEDDIVVDTLITHGGQVVNHRVREALGVNA